jgi:hypothetical protein
MGLHKTGTTAIQSSLRRREGWLRGQNILVPRSGCPNAFYSGHHNIAWQLTGDRRFDPVFGDLTALAKELDNFPGNVVLSSEDFESALTMPHYFQPLLELSRNHNKQMVIIIYIRNQVSYLESLCNELLKHGFGGTVDAMVDDILNCGRIRFRDWMFHFDYSRIDAKLSAIPEIQVVFRSYDELRGASIVADFLSVIGADFRALSGRYDNRINQRLGLAESLALFYLNRLGRRPSSSEAMVFERLAIQLREQRCEAGRGIEAALTRIFAAGNARLCSRAGLPPNALARHKAIDDGGAAPKLRLERLFSSETQREISAAAAKVDGSASLEDGNELLSASEARLIRSWLGDQADDPGLSGD